MTDLNQAIQAFLSLRAEYKEADRTSKRLHKAMKQAERAAVDVMLKVDQDIHRSPSTGICCTLKAYLGCKVTVDNQDQVRDWLINTLGDDKDFIEERVIKKEVIDLIKQKRKEAIKAGMVASFPDFLGVETYPGLSVSGA